MDKKNSNTYNKIQSVIKTFDSDNVSYYWWENRKRGYDISGSIMLLVDFRDDSNQSIKRHFTFLSSGLTDKISDKQLIDNINELVNDNNKVRIITTQSGVSFNIKSFAILESFGQ